MNAPATPETARPLVRFVSAHPWWFMLMLVVIIEIILLPISLLFRVVVQFTHIPTQLARDVIEALLVCTALLFIARLGWWRRVGFITGIAWKNLLICVFPVLYTLFIALSNLHYLAILGPGQFISLAFFCCLIGMAEETLFRGLILQTLLPGGVVRAVFLSSLIFGLFHIPNLLAGLPPMYVAGQVLAAIGIGVIYAVLRLRSGTIWLVIFLHGLNDFGPLARMSKLGAPPTSLAATLTAAGIIWMMALVYAAIGLRPKKLLEIRLRFFFMDSAAPLISSANPNEFSQNDDGPPQNDTGLSQGYSPTE